MPGAGTGPLLGGNHFLSRVISLLEWVPREASEELRAWPETVPEAAALDPEDRPVDFRVKFRKVLELVPVILKE